MLHIITAVVLIIITPFPVITAIRDMVINPMALIVISPEARMFITPSGDAIEAIPDTTGLILNIIDMDSDIMEIVIKERALIENLDNPDIPKSTLRNMYIAQVSDSTAHPKNTRLH